MSFYDPVKDLRWNLFENDEWLKSGYYLRYVIRDKWQCPKYVSGIHFSNSIPWLSETTIVISRLRGFLRVFHTRRNASKFFDFSICFSLF